MKFYLKRQPFKLGERFSIRDETDKDVLAVEGERFDCGSRLRVFDHRGKEIASVRQQILGWQPSCQIEINGKLIGSVVRRFAFIGTRFEVDGPDWVADGDFEAHEFIVTEDERTLMTVRQSEFTWGDSVELSIASRDKILPAVCVLLAIDLAIDASQRPPVS
jgi:uncharacterized protein YxjI